MLLSMEIRVPVSDRKRVIIYGIGRLRKGNYLNLLFLLTSLIF